MINVSITQAFSTKMSEWRVSGVLPESIVPEVNGDWVVYVNVVPGGMTVVSHSGSGEILVKARGFGKAMTALADRFDMPVLVERDHGVDFGAEVCQVYATTESLGKAVVQDAFANKIEAQRAVAQAAFLAEYDDDGTPLDGADDRVCRQCDLSTRESWRPVRRFSKHKASLNGRSKWKSRR